MTTTKTTREMQFAFKILKNNKSPVAFKTYKMPSRYRFGQWMPETKPNICVSGYHVAPRPEDVALFMVDKSDVYIAEVKGKVVHEQNKSAWSRIRLIHRVNVTREIAVGLFVFKIPQEDKLFQTVVFEEYCGAKIPPSLYYAMKGSAKLNGYTFRLFEMLGSKGFEFQKNFWRFVRYNDTAKELVTDYLKVVVYPKLERKAARQ